MLVAAYYFITSRSPAKRGVRLGSAVTKVLDCGKCGQSPPLPSPPSPPSPPPLPSPAEVFLRVPLQISHGREARVQGL